MTATDIYDVCYAQPNGSLYAWLQMMLSSVYPFLTQWKAAPKSRLMDSKLRCVFVEGEPRETIPEEEASAPPAETQERVTPVD